MSDIGTRMSDIGRYRYPDVGYKYPDVGYRYPDVGYRYLDVGYRYPMSDIGTRMSDIDIGRRIYIYWTSGINIGCLIYILDVRYRFRKQWWHFVLNGAS